MDRLATTGGEPGSVQQQHPDFTTALLHIKAAFAVASVWALAVFVWGLL
ncbi:MAG: hypothetical protein Q7U66_14840 [Methylobacter sp.]|nr:hypothetical protein [Methylobacter sp.]